MEQTQSIIKQKYTAGNNHLHKRPGTRTRSRLESFMLIMSVCLLVWICLVSRSAGYTITGFTQKTFPDVYSDFSEEHRHDLIKASLGAKTTSREGFKSEIVYSHIYSRIQRDGSTDTYYDVAQKVNSPDIKQLLGERSIVFDSSREAVTFLKATVYLSSGKEIETDVSEPIERSPFTGLVYSDVKLKILSIRGVEDGSVIRLAFRKTAKLSEESDFIHESIGMTTNIPVKEGVSVVEVEGGTPLVVSERIRGGLTGFGNKKYKLENNNNVYIYSVKNLRPIEPEPFSVPSSENFSAVSFLTQSTWNGIARWYYSKSRDKTNPGKDIAEKAVELTKNKTDEKDRIKSLYDYVRNIRYVSITLDQHRLIPHDATTTLRNQYGDCKDKSTLLVALLKSVGIPSYICLVNTRQLIDKSLPTPRAFNHAIVVIPSRQGWYTFLDPTSSTTPYGYTPGYLENRNGLVVKEDSGDFILIPPDDPEKEAQSATVKIELLDLKKARISMTTVSDGSSDIAKLLEGASPDKMKKSLSLLMSARFGETEVESVDVKKGIDKEKEQLVTHITMTVTNALKRMGEFYTLQSFAVNMINSTLPAMVSTPDRKTDMEVPRLLNTSLDVTVMIPEGVVVQYAPASRTLKSRFGEYSCTVNRSENLIKIESRFTLKKKRIAGKDYREFKEFIKSFLDHQGENILLRKLDT